MRRRQVVFLRKDFLYLSLFDTENERKIVECFRKQRKEAIEFTFNLLKSRLAGFGMESL